jgi:hypothetical protein
MGRSADFDRSLVLTEISLLIAPADQTGQPLNVAEQAALLAAKYPHSGLTVDDIHKEMQRVSSSKSGHMKGLPIVDPLSPEDGISKLG